MYGEKMPITGMSQYASAANQKPMDMEKVVATVRGINQMGFGYLFENPEIPNESVFQIMRGGDGVVRYSQQLSLAHGRSLAVVLFRCAQIVFQRRNSMTEAPIFDGQVVVQASRIHTDADLSGEEVEMAMRQLTDVGVLTQYSATRGGEGIFYDWYTFADENVYFPAPNESKMSQTPTCSPR